MKTIKCLKKGELFRIKENGTVYVRGDYDRTLKKVNCSKFDDMNFERFFQSQQVVIVDFEF